jgi:T3SS negative regulator,GrlR
VDARVPGAGRFDERGVIVLKDGHVFGGDSGRYYIGTFTAQGTKVDGHLRITWYSGARATAWGDEADVVDAKVAGDVGPNTITGKVSRSGHHDLDFRMTKRADLPSSIIPPPRV